MHHLVTLDDFLDTEVAEPLGRFLQETPFELDRAFASQVSQDVAVAKSEGHMLEEFSHYKGFVLERWIRKAWGQSVNGTLAPVAGAAYVQNGIMVNASNLGNVILTSQKRKPKRHR